MMQTDPATEHQLVEVKHPTGINVPINPAIDTLHGITNDRYFREPMYSYLLSPTSGIEQLWTTG